MKLLFKGKPMIFEPDVAEKLGLNESIILQQLYYLLFASPHKRDGHTWYIHSYDSWLKRFKFWSKSTVKRTFQNLEKNGYIISTSKYNQRKNDRKKWYTLNYEKLAEIGNLNSDFPTRSGFKLTQLSIQNNHIGRFKINPRMESI